METSRVLLVHWGKSGAGPRFLFELGTAYATRYPGQVALSYNREAEMRRSLEGFVGAQLPVRTYSSTVGVIGRAYRLVWNGMRLRWFVRAIDASRVVCVMESIYQSIAVPIFLPRHVTYVVCVHDATQHPGDEHILKRINRVLEVSRANVLVAFSGAVTRSLRSKVKRPIPVVESAHPAFGVGDSAVSVRGLPGDGPIVIGFFGRLLPYKGLDVFVEAAELLAGQEPRLVFSVVGEGPEGKRLSKVSDQVQWRLGWVPEEEVASVVAGFDILVVPYIEASQSGVIAQAMALGVPVVVTPVEGLLEQVSRSGCGVVAHAVSASAVAAAVHELLRDGGLYRRASAAGIEASRGDYSWARLVEDLESGTELPDAASIPPGLARRCLFWSDPERR